MNAKRGKTSWASLRELARAEKEGREQPTGEFRIRMVRPVYRAQDNRVTTTKTPQGGI